MSNLIECIDCGNQVSKRAESCPKCGAPQAEPATDLEKEYEDSHFNHKAPLVTKIKNALKNDPNKNLIIIIVFLTGLFLFLAWAIFNTDIGLQMWNAEYRLCRETYRAFYCQRYY